MKDGKKKTRFFGKGMKLFLLLGLLAGCREAPKERKAQQQEVEIPVIFQIDPASDHKNNEELAEAFNQEYEGRYQIRVQWLFDTTSAYRAQIKLLNVTDDLPAVMTDVAFSPGFSLLLEEAGRLVDLGPILEEDKQWREWIDKEVLEPCYEEDGSLYIMPISSNCFSYSGIFYNKELFARAGIEEFPDTWEEFWRCAKKLEGAGITPLALHTEGTGWASMLLATAYIGTSDEGREFLSQRLPESYNGFGRQMGEVLGKAFSYTTTEGINQDFDTAYEQFVREDAAMLPNGYWMMGMLDKKLAQKVGFAPFPENVLVVSPQMSGWAVAASYPEEVRQGAVEFLRFRSWLARTQAEDFLDEQRTPSSDLERDYIQAIKESHRTVANYQIQWNPILQEKILPRAIEKLAKGEIDAEIFEQMLNDSVEQFERER